MQGWLRKTGAGRHDFECLDGRVFEGIQDIAGAPRNVLVRAHLAGDRLESYDVIGAAYRDEAQKRVALVRVVRSGGQVEAAWGQVRRMARSIEQYVHLSNVAWDVVEITPFVVVSDQSPGLQFNFQREAEQLAQIDPDWQRHNYMGTVGGAQSGLKGIAHIGSWKFAVFALGMSDPRVVIHELYHCCGIEHDWRGMDAYGGSSMQGKHYSGHNAAHLLYLGQIQDHEVVDIDTGATFLLPVECRPEDARPGEYRAARIIRNNEINIVSVHRDDHQTAWGKGRLIDGYVWIHRYDPPNRPSFRTYEMGRWNPDEPIELPNGAVVTVTGRKDGVTRIAVDSDQRPDFPDWPAVPADIHAMDETAAGIWYAPEYQFQGFRLHVQGTHVVGYWFTHLPEGGRVWLFLDGHIEDGHVLLDVYRTDGRERQLDGAARLYLTGPDEGIIKYRCQTFGVDHQHLERLAERGGASSGVWETGELQGVSVLDLGDESIAYEFTYQGDAPDWAVYTGPEGDWRVYGPECQYKGLHGESGASERVTELPSGARVL